MEWFLLHFSLYFVFFSFCCFQCLTAIISFPWKLLKSEQCLWSLKCKEQSFFFPHRFSMIILRMSHSSWKWPSKLLWNNHGCYYTHLQMWFKFSETPLHFEWELAALKDLTSHWKTIKASVKMNLRLFFRIEISRAFHSKLQPPKSFSLLQIFYIFIGDLPALINTC